MTQGNAFGKGGFGRGKQGVNPAKVAAVAIFGLLSIIALGVPMLSRPAVIVAPVVPTPVPMVDVFMPLQRIPSGTQLTPLMFKREQKTLDDVARFGAQPIKNESELLARYARVLIMPGKPLMMDEVTDTPDSLLTKQIRPGYRAVTIQVNNVSGIEGWSVPKSRVDVIWVSQKADSGDEVVATIVKGAQVLSVLGKTEIQLPGHPEGAGGRTVAESKGGASSPNQSASFTVTLLVTPEDGRKIFLASRTGELSLMLRGEFDASQEVDSKQSITTKTLLDDYGATKRADERVEGVAKALRPDGSYEEWSVIEGRVWRWDDGQATQKP